MQKAEKIILSTAQLESSLVTLFRSSGIDIDVEPFIRTEHVPVDEFFPVIRSIDKRSAVVFTSTTAVNSVARLFDKQSVDWRIFCIGNTTKDSIIQKFGGNNIE